MFAQQAAPGAVMNLQAFVGAVFERSRAMCDDARFPADQQALLRQTLERCETHSADFDQPLALMYLVLRAWQVVPDERALWLGTASWLYVLSGDLFDDVQDEDLAGKPHANEGPAIATNSALTLLFLAFDALRRALQLEPDPKRGLAYFQAFNRVSLLAVGCQHSDLRGLNLALSRQQVTERDQGKTCSVALFLECGALAAGCTADQVERYRALGEKLAAFAQIIDDVRDIYAKPVSPDLATGKLTYPIACFLESASPKRRERFTALCGQLPSSLPAIRQLLYSAGAVEQSALAADQLRKEFYAEIQALDQRHGAHRVLCHVLDTLGAGLYEPEPIPGMSEYFQVSTAFGEQVQQCVAQWYAALAEFCPPAPPELRAWHLSHFLYVPAQRCIYYPDLDQLPEDVLPFYAQQWQCHDLEGARRLLQQHLPLVVAHELAHFWRHQVGALSDDVWHEEHVANSLAVAYCNDHAQAALALCLRHLEPVLRQSVLGEIELAKLEASARYTCAQELDLDIEEAVHLHAHMIRGAAARGVRLAAELRRWLRRPNRARRAQTRSTVAAVA